MIIPSIILACALTHTQHTDPLSLPALVTNALTGDNAQTDSLWLPEFNALLIELVPSPYYNIHLHERGLWQAGVPAGVLIEHCGLDAACIAGEEERLVASTDGPVTVQTTTMGFGGKSPDGPAYLIIEFALPADIQQRSPNGIVSDLWDVDCDGEVSNQEAEAISLMLLFKDQVSYEDGIAGLDPVTTMALSGIVVVPAPEPCGAN